jgi:hypothetical protein
VAKVVDSSQVQIALFKKKLSPLFELTFVLLRFDHVASVIVNANHGHVSGCKTPPNLPLLPLRELLDIADDRKAECH